MSHQECISIFQAYTKSLYAAASRMLDKRHSQYQDKLQDLVILAYEEFIRKAEQGIVMSLPLLINYMKLRKSELQIEMRGYSRTHKKDIFNKRNYYEGKLELFSLDNPLDSYSGESFSDILSPESNPEEALCAQIDMQQSLSELHPNEQKIIQMKLHGYSNKEISRELHLQPDTIKDTLTHLASKFLGRESPQLELRF